METTNTIMEPVFQRAEQYARTNIELYKLKGIDKASGIFSVLMTTVMTALIFLLFVFFISIAMAFYLNDIFRNSYYGFLGVAVFYFMVICLFFLFKKIIQRRLRNYAIRQFNKAIQ